MKTVALLGNASRTRDFCPYDNPAVEIWPTGVHSFKAKRMTAMLEMHPDVLTGERFVKAPEGEAYKRWLRTQTEIPVWQHDVNPEIPMSRKYPREEIEAEYCRNLYLGEREVKDFFGGTASYALALAIWLGFERVELYGIELSSRPEYDDERDCFFFWIGKATANGVEVVGQENTRLLREILYPRK